MATPFTAKTLAFLRALKRNNDREWFRARKATYEQVVRGPMIDVIGRLAVDFRTFAPDLVASPTISLYRIYRDTRFSEDKSPLKTHIGAYFPTRGFAKGEGAGLYFELNPEGVWIGGGLYRPSTPALVTLREPVAVDHQRLRFGYSLRLVHLARNDVHLFRYIHQNLDECRGLRFDGDVEPDD